MRPRISGAKVGVVLPGQLGPMCRLEAVDAPPQLLELADAGVDSSPSRAQPLSQVWADGFVGLFEVDASDLADLGNG